MRVFVTGGTGFVGGHLVERLAGAGHEVIAAVRRTAVIPGAHRVVEVDWDEVGSLARAADDADAVVHAAGGGKPPGGRDPEDAIWRQNVDTTVRLLEAVGDRRIVFVSSLSAHGPSLDGGRPARGAAPSPRSTYGRSKLEAERRVAGCRSALILRPPPVYGPGDRNFLALFRAAGRGVVPVIGRQAHTSLVHVHDLADAVVAGVGSDLTGSWFVDDGDVHTWGGIVDTLGDVLGRRVRAVPVPRRALPWAAVASEAFGRWFGGPVFLSRDKVVDMCQLHWVCGAAPSDALGWAPRVRLREGLAETAAWYRAKGWL